MATTEIRFRRWGFHRGFEDTDPKWHIATHDLGAQCGTWTGLCGYVFQNNLGDLYISRAKKRPPKRLICTKCLEKSA